MSDAPAGSYRPLLLTEEEHQRLFGELLKAPEGFKEERLLDLLSKADARSKDIHLLSTSGGGAVVEPKSASVPSLPPPANAAAWWLFIVMAAGTAIVVFIGVLASILVRR